MLVLGFGPQEGEDDEWKGELQTLKMIQMLQEAGWDYSYGRDPVLILIEIEEIIENGESNES